MALIKFSERLFLFQLDLLGHIHQFRYWRKIEEEDMEKKQCLECGNPIPYGSRKDKLFCSEKCKNRYHYEKTFQMKARNVHLRVLNALEKNYRILEAILRDKVRCVNIADLSMKGFNTNYVTAFCKARPHDIYWCFDIRYCMSQNRIYKISRVEYS